MLRLIKKSPKFWRPLFRQPAVQSSVSLFASPRLLPIILPLTIILSQMILPIQPNLTIAAVPPTQPPNPCRSSGGNTPTLLPVAKTLERDLALPEISPQFSPHFEAAAQAIAQGLSYDRASGVKADAALKAFVAGFESPSKFIHFVSIRVSQLTNGQASLEPISRDKLPGILKPFQFLRMVRRARGGGSIEDILQFGPEGFRILDDPRVLWRFASNDAAIAHFEAAIESLQSEKSYVGNETEALIDPARSKAWAFVEALKKWDQFGPRFLVRAGQKLAPSKRSISLLLPQDLPEGLIKKDPPVDPNKPETRVRYFQVTRSGFFGSKTTLYRLSRRGIEMIP